ncbi:MAG TPA: hypothetical protein VK760_09205 [Candidatus Acidoferrales bacterium]|jgi:hypothetical protein|nr:hypothetical protein [Candidatus Acidoferrales bacterium]
MISNERARTIDFVISSFALAAALALAAPDVTQTAGEPATCATIAAYHRLDFWIGTWIAYDGQGRALGSDVVSSILANCAIQESWSDADGSHGLGIIYYSNFTNQWTKLYLSERANLRGGMTQRTLVAEFPDGGVRFEGVVPGAPGESRVIDRTTIRPLPDGRVHYVKEVTRDGGDRWVTTFEAFYVRTQA